MSAPISKRIQQLEIQNVKLKKLLETTLQITSEDAEKRIKLENETVYLKAILSDLENQKKQLEEELNQHLNHHDCWTIPESKLNVNIQNKLNKALNDIQRGTTEVQQLKTDNLYLQNLIEHLEIEKEKLLSDISLVKKANEEHSKIAEEKLHLKQDLALLESKCTIVPNCSKSEDYLDKLAALENRKQEWEEDIKISKESIDPLGIPVENAVLELKIAGVNKEKQRLITAFKTTLLQSANEISTLHRNTSDGQLRNIMNEIDATKTTLMMNINDIKEIHCEHLKNEKLDEIEDTDEIILQKDDDDDDCTIIEENDELCDEKPELIANEEEKDEDEDVPEEEDSNELEFHELPPVSEEDELQNELLLEHEQLQDELSRLENEREALITEIQHVNEQKALLKETDKQKPPLDDATNQMYANEEQILMQRIRELERENEEIKRDLRNVILEETAEDEKVLEEGEKLINDYKDEENNKLS